RAPRHAATRSARCDGAHGAGERRRRPACSCRCRSGQWRRQAVDAADVLLALVGGQLLGPFGGGPLDELLALAGVGVKRHAVAAGERCRGHEEQLLAVDEPLKPIGELWQDLPHGRDVTGCPTTPEWFSNLSGVVRRPLRRGTATTPELSTRCS